MSLTNQKRIAIVGCGLCGIIAYFTLPLLQKYILESDVFASFRRDENRTSAVNLCPNTQSCSLPGPQDNVWSSLRWRNATVQHVLYNRVPKTGSSVIRAVIETLRKRNHFNWVSSKINIVFNLSYSGQEHIVQKIMGIKTPLVYDRHIHFVDFTRFGMNQPIYINTVREPIQHFLSFYYYMRGMSHWRFRYTENDRNMTLDECLARKADCEPHRQLRFFCGQDSLCNSPKPSEAALQLAKRNIERHYAVVGINEDLAGFCAVLEYVLPQIFSGASKAYKAKQNSFRWFTTKKLKKPLKATSMVKLNEMLKLDFDLYHFVKQRFFKLKCISANCRHRSNGKNRTQI